MAYRNLLFRKIRRFASDERASVPVEYGMIAVLIAVVCVVVIRSIGTRTNDNFTGILAGLL